MVLNKTIIDVEEKAKWCKGSHRGLKIPCRDGVRVRIPFWPYMKYKYGCGREVHFILSNGKHCCSDHYSKCPAIRKKTSMASVKEGYRDSEKLEVNL